MFVVARGDDRHPFILLPAAPPRMPMRRNRVLLVANRYRPVACQDHYPPMVR
jgi:DNA (cytosine-5)-methyltransferase 1